MNDLPENREVQIPGKSYFRIGEVSRIVGVEPYVIRYWESEFKAVRPLRTKSDQRLYRRKDVETLLSVKFLLYEERFTIAGAKKRLAELRTGKEFSEASPPPAAPDDRHLLAEVKRALLEIQSILT